MVAAGVAAERLRFSAVVVHMSTRRPVVLIVRDGWGHNPYPEMNAFNAIHLARTPVDDALLAQYPNVQIHTSGEDVGLPAGVMGNSEVGHQNLGAGRIVDQELMRISRLIRSGQFFQNEELHRAINYVQQTGGTLHLLGLLSDGGVHSHIEHACALVDLCRQRELASDRVAVHVITDGRDTSPTSGLGFVQRLEAHLAKAGTGRIASVCGRFYAMDRDFRWDRVVRAYKLLTAGGERVFATAEQAVNAYYAAPTEASRSGDEFIEPSVVSKTGRAEPWQLVKDGDALVFFNYRGDRPRELTKAFVLDDAAWSGIQGGGFDRGKRLEKLHMVTLTEYESGMPVNVALLKPPKMANILGGYLHSMGKAQFRCAESEKHPHVTYFFNDYKKGCFQREFQLDIPSPKYVSTYDQLPAMSANAVGNSVINAIDSELFDFILVNFANGDMVGHTGVLSAAIAAVETVDQEVGRIVAAVKRKGGALVVTADHGNAEQMIDPATGGPHTQHTTYDVDLIVVSDDHRGARLRPDGRLADVAPTVLDLMGLAAPSDMTGVSLLK